MSETTAKADREEGAAALLPTAVTPSQNQDGPQTWTVDVAPSANKHDAGISPSAADPSTQNDGGASPDQKTPAYDQDHRREPALRQQLGEQLNMSFWVSVLSNALAGVITAWVIFLVGSMVAIAARGSTNAEIGWVAALATGAMCLVLGATLVLGFASAVAMLRPVPPRRPPSKGWLFLVLVVGAFAASSWDGVLGVGGVVGAWSTLGLTFATAGLAVGVFRGPRSRPKVWRTLLWFSATLSLVGVVTSGITIGATLSRALSGS